MLDLEEDEKRTHDGSVDWKGVPAIKGKTGGWSAGILLLGKLSPENNQILSYPDFHHYKSKNIY